MDAGIRSSGARSGSITDVWEKVSDSNARRQSVADATLGAHSMAKRNSLTEAASGEQLWRHKHKYNASMTHEEAGTALPSAKRHYLKWEKIYHEKEQRLLTVEDQCESGALFGKVFLSLDEKSAYRAKILTEAQDEMNLAHDKVEEYSFRLNQAQRVLGLVLEK